MTAPVADLFADPGQAMWYRRGQLAIAFQEALTATVRLRTGRQVGRNEEAFRLHFRRLLTSATDEARRLQYEDRDVKLAVYAVIVFLDESVLGSGRSMFAEWPQRPLQEEIFGSNVGGERFFDDLTDVLTRPETDDLADLLEIFQLCLLLGYEGKFRGSDGGAITGRIADIANRIERTRGPSGPLSVSPAVPESERLPVRVDPWFRRLALAAGASFGVAVILLLVFKLALMAGLSGLTQP